jgi:DNA-binding transcriptional ArsR family regulator
MSQVKSSLAIAEALSDATRLSLLNSLSNGPSSVSELVAALGESQSKISNHLALLRNAGLVQCERQGRKMIYRLGGEAVATLLEALGAMSRGADQSKATPVLAQARSCYDHVAGALGVRLFELLLDEGAIEVDGDEVNLGPRGEKAFDSLGVDVTQASRARRRYVVKCLDWTERQSHLGGSLGSALCASLVKRGWIVRRSDTRGLRITPKGRGQLTRLLGKGWEQPSS